MEISIKQPSLTNKISTSKTVANVDKASLSITEKFTKFYNELEGNRILLMSALILIQGCLVVPVTLLITSFIDIGLGGVTVSVLVAGTVGVLVTNISESPTKLIVITALLSIVSSLTLIAIHLLSIQ